MTANAYMNKVVCEPLSWHEANAGQKSGQNNCAVVHVLSLVSSLLARSKPWSALFLAAKKRRQMHRCRCAYEDCASLLISKQKVSRYRNSFKSLLFLYSILSPRKGVRSHLSCIINYNLYKWKTSSSSGNTW